MIVPVRWPQDAREREALRTANGVDLVMERARQVVVLGGLVLLLLLVLRLVIG